MGGPAFKELKVWGPRPRNRWLQRERWGSPEEEGKLRVSYEPVSSTMKSRPPPGFKAKVDKDKEEFWRWKG